ncbi:hypothetical protein [Calidithermus roseus]|uniref:Phage Mu protein F like protein n=1 Tax=Calidithermus roseus TaxID=1644118 RepID=A0A399F1A4_9DEIN|nr:hypothetical protein [Calidithermus roseus]RIH89456.1 hypothetical protein Mrose_00356 [Calidithermus roseus]
MQQEYGATYFSAERLVRTLYNSGANRAQFEALKAAGYTHKRWLAARDSRVRTASKGHCFDHRRMEGVTVPLEQPFVTPAGSRLMYPGDRSLGAPAGEVVNCRCTIIGVMVEQEQLTGQLEYERPKAGVHFSRWRATSEANHRTILRGLSRAGLLNWLKDNPLGEIRVVQSLYDESGPFHGVYNPADASIRLSLERPDIGQQPAWGELNTVSAIADNPNAAAQISLVHETGHHILTVLGRQMGSALEDKIRKAWNQANYVSGRASVNWKEYFCETHCAYVYLRDELQVKDPLGYNLIREIRRMIGTGD